MVLQDEIGNNWMELNFDYLLFKINEDLLREGKINKFYLRKDEVNVVHFDLVEKLLEILGNIVDDNCHMNYPDNMAAMPEDLLERNKEFYFSNFFSSNLHRKK